MHAVVFKFSGEKFSGGTGVEVEGFSELIYRFERVTLIRESNLVKNPLK